MTLRVLLVDEDPERAATLRAALQAAGYEVVADARTAVDDDHVRLHRPYLTDQLNRRAHLGHHFITRTLQRRAQGRGALGVVINQQYAQSHLDVFSSI